MKLRLQSNSIRLRLKQGEVEQFARTGRLEEKIIFGSGPGETLHYILETSSAISDPQARISAGQVLVRIPPARVAHWASSDDVGMESSQSVGGQTRLHILVEKDFACLDGTEEQNADTFPNPLAEA